MKRLVIIALLVTAGLSTFAQWDVRNKIFRQIATGDTITQRIYDGYDTFDGTNPIYVNYYDSTAFVGNRGMGVGTQLTTYGNFTVTGNSTLGNAANDTLFFQGQDTIVDIITQEYIVGNVANSTTTLDTVYTTYVSNGTFTEAYITVTLADDATYNLPNAKTITATIMVNADDNLLLANVTTAGVVTLAVNSGTDPFANSDSDTDYCLYDGGTFAVLKNRNGAPATFYLKLMYNK